MKVSLVMGVFNGEKYLKETLESILAQTYKDLEIIVVDDGSTDSTSNMLKEIKDERVKVIHLEVNQGVANALNIGIAQANGHYIAIHDADDISLPSRIEEQIAYLSANPHVIAVGSFIECIADKDTSADKYVHMKNLERYKNSIITWEQIKEELFKGSPITHGSLVMTKEAYLKAGKYDSQYKIASDYDFYTRLANVGPIQNVPKVLYKYRISDHSLSNSNVKDTSDEFIVASTRYIKNYCFPYKKEKPSVVVYGTKEGTSVFKNLMLSNQILRVQETMFRYENEKIKNLYKAGNIDAFIILANAPEEDRFIRFLRGKGLKLNRDYFTLWSAV